MLQKFLNHLGSGKTQKIVFSVVLLLSILVIIFKTVSIQQTAKEEEENIRYADATVNHVVTYSSSDEQGNIIEHYDVQVSFTVDNNTYSNITINDTVPVQIGNNVTVKYYEGYPENCQIETTKGFNLGLFLFYLFFIFLAVGSIAIISFISKQERIENQKKVRAEINEQHRKDEEAISFLKRDYYQTEPNPFDNSTEYNSTDLYTGDENPFDDTTDYSQMYDQHDVTDSFCDAEGSYTGYEGQQNNNGFYGSSQEFGTEPGFSDTPSVSPQNPFSDNNDYSNSLGSGVDAYADPFAPYSGYDDKH